jgi:hypothetical protein
MTTAGVGAIDATNVRRRRVRLVRAERHLVAGGIGLIATVFLLDHATSPSGFLALAIGLGVTLSSLARAVDAGFGQFYGWLYGEPVIVTRVDRLAFRVIHRHRYGDHEGLRSARPRSGPQSHRLVPIEETKIRIVAVDDAASHTGTEKRSNI